MKHSLSMTVLLLVIFLTAQYLGLAIVYQYVDQEKTLETGKTAFKELPIGERPPMEEKTSFIPVIIAVLIGTAILWLLIRYNLLLVWKLWFLVAVVAALTIAWSVLIKKEIAFVLALLVGTWKIFKPNVWVHNFTELFIYGGLAAIFTPLFNLLSVSILMILIAGYDAYAVWKSKHMVSLAQSQAKAKLFAGLLIPYKLPRIIPQKKGRRMALPVKVRTAVLGGGDIGFPLIFAGVVFKEMGLWPALVIPLFAGLGLGFLLWRAEEKKFYPAMPFIGAGCFLGLIVGWLISLI